MDRLTWVWVTVAGLLAVVALGVVLRALPGPEGPDVLEEIPPPGTKPAPEAEPEPEVPQAPTELAADAFVTTESGLRYAVLSEGTGDVAEAGDTVAVHYTGWLEEGRLFDSSLSRGRPIRFPLGQGEVIAGWDEGVAGMKEGGRRQLRVPPDLGYGEKGFPPRIPPDAALVFEVELVDVR